MSKLLTSILLITLLFYSVGCASFNNWINGDSKDHYPSEVKGLCEQARGEARQVMINAGLSVANEPAVKVNLVPAVGKQRGEWVFYYAPYQGNVCGVYYDGRIKIACNPANHADIDYDTLLHEFKHYFCDNNGYGVTHIKQIKW